MKAEKRQIQVQDLVPNKVLVASNRSSNTWTQLSDAVIAIQSLKGTISDYQDFYEMVKALCDMGRGADIYQRLEFLVDQHIRKILAEFSDSDLESLHFLKTLNECWQTNCQQMEHIRSIFHYLDRTYVLPVASLSSIWEMGLAKFRLYFNNNSRLLTRTVGELLKLVDKERNGEQVDRSLLKDLLTMLSNLSIYSKVFEPRFLNDTELLYQSEAQLLAHELDVPEYLIHVDKRLKEEQDRVAHYLDNSTKDKLISTVERELLEKHLGGILDRGLELLLNKMKLQDLILLHDLALRVKEGSNQLCATFNKYIKQRGKVFVTNPEKDKTMVQDLLSFKEEMDTVVLVCFQKQEKFMNSLKEAFEHFINQRPNKPAELIAKYIDVKLRSGNKEATEEELERLLDQIMVIFRFIHGKDVFEAFYKKDLAKRLLLDKSASIDAEKSMLSKLKQECGAAFTNKLEGMFKDIELSTDILVPFKNYLTNTGIGNDFDGWSIAVLTMGYWPTYSPMVVKIPDNMLQYQRVFQQFYVQKHNGRKLQWQSNLGTCVLNAYYPTCKKEFQVSEYQALVLLLFVDSDEKSFKEIADATSIETVELKRTLQSVACGKTRVLIKEPKSREVSEDDKFIYAPNFQHPLCRIKINQVQLKETPEEQSITQERVFQDRQYQIDAAIVRIMKTRKSLTHNQLVAEIFEQLKFPVKAHDIKKRIESLIERDYIVRDKDNAQLYNYVA